MSELITTAYPVTLPESGRSRSAREQRPWYLVKRPSADDVGITAELEKDDEVIDVYEVEGE